MLMTLVLAMYVNETVVAALNWYLGWLAFVKYSGSNDQALAVFFFSEETPRTVLYMNDVAVLVATLRLGIADSIMVSHFRFCVFSYANQLFRSGAVGSSVIVVGEQ